MSRLTKKQQFWTTHIDRWQSGNLSQADYCQRNQLKVRDFYRWKNRLTAIIKNNNDQATARGQFLPVAIQEVVSEPFTIKASGVSIEFDSSLAPKTLKQLLAAIGVSL